MATDRIERDIIIDAPLERVWAALTEARHLGHWFGDAGAEIDLRPGGALMLRWKEHGVALGRVEEVEPNRAFAFRWALVPDEEPVPGNSTHVRFTLESVGPRSTRLRMVETGFDSLDGGEIERRRRLDENQAGWDSELSELESLLAEQPVSR